MTYRSEDVEWLRNWVPVWDVQADLVLLDAKRQLDVFNVSYTILPNVFPPPDDLEFVLVASARHKGQSYECAIEVPSRDLAPQCQALLIQAISGLLASVNPP